MARYAITFDLDTNTLAATYHNESWRNAYTDIANILEQWDFERQQGSVYFSRGECAPVDCVLAVQEIATEFDWFAPSLKDIRMLRIEEENDLMAAVRPTNRRRTR
jgi:virulence-associated protein VapD